MIIRRQRQATQSLTGLPTTFASSATPNSNFYIHVDTSSRYHDHLKRRRKTLKEKYNWIQILNLITVGSIYYFCIGLYNLMMCSPTKTTRRLSAQLSKKKSNFTVIFPRGRFQLPLYQLSAPPRNDRTFFVASKTPNYGNLQLRFPETPNNFARIIYHDTNEDMRYRELWHNKDDDGDIHPYYNFDDDEKRNPYVMYDDPDINLHKKCRRTSWHRDLPIACNNIHEYDFLSHIQMGDTRFLGSGYYRTVFSTEAGAPQQQRDQMVMKMLNWRFNFTFADFEYMRMDAIVNEKLNGNPEIVTSYGFCGNTVIGESMTYGDLHKIAIPSGIGRNIPDLNEDGDDLLVRNNISAIKKLQWSLEMAEAVALLHSYPGGVIVHDDIQLPQFLLSESGKLKLNDFNRAEIMLWNEKDQEYCKYRNNPGWGDWRAPEEYLDDPLDEKIDIWSLGNNMYSLLTGVYPFHTLTEEETKDMVSNGTTAYIDPRFLEQSYAESKIVEAILQCWIYDPHKRIDIFHLVELLRNAVRENNKLQPVQHKNNQPATGILRRSKSDANIK